MTIIHTSFKKRKPKKPTAKQRDLQADWEKLLKKYETKPVPKGTAMYKQPKTLIRETPHYPSLNSGLGNATKPIHHEKVYTGTAMKGIGTMHKSNAVPIFSDDAAIDIAKMRR
jgi:hypothetical protein